MRARQNSAALCAQLLAHFLRRLLLRVRIVASHEITLARLLDRADIRQLVSVRDGLFMTQERRAWGGGCAHRVGMTWL